MLRQRILTAAVLVPPVVAAVLWLPLGPLALVLAGVVVLAALEWAGIMRIAGRPGRMLFAGGIGLLLALTAAAGQRQPELTAAVVLGLAVAWWLVALAWILVFPAGLPEGRLLRGRQMVAGACVLVPAWFAVVGLRARGPAGGWLLLFLMLLIWAADIAAYFGGRAFGRHKLAPHVSPGKTWEGALAGLSAGTVAAAALALPLGVTPARTPAFVVLCALVVAVSILGDLAVSMFKRHARLKDSGSLLPGHGGMLDRIDSLTAAAPAFLLGIKLLGLFR